MECNRIFKTKNGYTNEAKQIVEELAMGGISEEEVICSVKEAFSKNNKPC